MSAEREGAKMKQWENIGQNGKWNFWYFNSLIIVKLLIRFATDGNFVVRYKEREWTWLMDVLWRLPSWWSEWSWKEMQVWLNRSLNRLVLIREESLGEPFVELCNRGKQFCLSSHREVRPHNEIKRE